MRERSSQNAPLFLKQRSACARPRLFSESGELGWGFHSTLAWGEKPGAALGPQLDFASPPAFLLFPPVRTDALYGRGIVCTMIRHFWHGVDESMRHTGSKTVLPVSLGMLL